MSLVHSINYIANNAFLFYKKILIGFGGAHDHTNFNLACSYATIPNAAPFHNTDHGQQTAYR